MAIKAVIFDVDGVLIDNSLLHYEALVRALKEFGCEYTAEDEKRFDTVPTRHKLSALANEGRIKFDDIDKIWERKGQIAIDYLNDPLIAKHHPSIKALFEYLFHKGIKIGICSNARYDFVEKVTERLDIKSYISIQLTADIELFPKPNPAMYLDIMCQMGVSPHETLILEDSKSGKEAAFRSGAHVFSVETIYDVPSALVGVDLNALYETPKIPYQSNQLNVLIPMAGAGSRFAKVGYTDPKPFITVGKGLSMIETVVQNLNIRANYIFLAQKEHLEQDRYHNVLKRIVNDHESKGYNGCSIVPIEGLTEGAACTALKAKPYIDWGDPLLIVNSDNCIDWDSVSVMETINNNKWMPSNVYGGSILVFNEKTGSNKWSFAKTNEEGYVTEVAEKKAISNWATTGHYFWKRGSDFCKYAKQMIDKNIRVNNEFYIAPVYNEAIEDGKLVTITEVKEMHSLGTPEDLKAYQERFKL